MHGITSACVWSFLLLGVERGVTGFQVTDEGGTVPMVRDDGLRSLS